MTSLRGYRRPPTNRRHAGGYPRCSGALDSSVYVWEFGTPTCFDREAAPDVVFAERRACQPDSDVRHTAANDAPRTKSASPASDQPPHLMPPPKGVPRLGSLELCDRVGAECLRIPPGADARFSDVIRDGLVFSPHGAALESTTSRGYRRSCRAALWLSEFSVHSAGPASRPIRRARSVICSSLLILVRPSRAASTASVGGSTVWPVAGLIPYSSACRFKPAEIAPPDKPNAAPMFS